MLTGDKIETATCIAISTGLKSKNQRLFEMKEMKSWPMIERRLKEFTENDVAETVLVVDGNTLNLVLGKSNEEYFINIVKEVILIRT